MRRYRVRITPKALEDMESIYAYIATELCAPGNAAEQYNRIADAMEQLDFMPERHRIIRSEPERTQPVRRMNVNNFSVFYVVDTETVTILRVLYGASDIESRL